MAATEDKMAHLLETRLSPRLLRIVRTTAAIAERQGVKAYLVGGPVRDLFLSRPVADLDIAIEGDAAAVGRALAQELGGRVKTTSQFGTVKLDLAGQRVDLAQTRRERYRRPGALPQVEPADITEDLARRDFTINAMAVALHHSAWGRTLKVKRSAEDIAAGLVRVLHNGSFQDDATRLLRAVRYEQRLGFRLEEHTKAIARRDAAMLDTIGGDRVRRELALIFQEPRPAACLQRLEELGLLQAIHPVLRWPSQSHQALAAASAKTPMLALWAILVHPCTTDEVVELEHRLNLPRSWARTAQDMVALRQRGLEFEAPSLRPSQVYHLLEGSDPFAIQGWALLQVNTTAGRWLRRYLEELRAVKTALRGDDLIALGVPQGPAVGGLLRELHAARLDGTLSSAREEREYVRRQLQGSAPRKPSPD